MFARLGSELATPSGELMAAFTKLIGAGVRRIPIISVCVIIEGELPTFTVEKFDRCSTAQEYHPSSLSGCSGEPREVRQRQRREAWKVQITGAVARGPPLHLNSLQAGCKLHPHPPGLCWESISW